MSWFTSDDEFEIPADILDRLENRIDVASRFDEPERSSVVRVVDIYQKIRWRNVQLETELIAAQTNMGYMREQIEDLVRRLRKTGDEPKR
ncbi:MULTISPECIES: hypothetical protein [Pseudomonas]|uniref:hypothetical protein n=1 Tax=Pseudomonas TaxID=286 RepID=UPI00147392D2|nr:MULTISPECIES: hypothetical protein [Pseudomonas]MEC4242149.1 hypothetical protein [Pseudomonas sp. DSV-1]NNB34074.1 hypothetical protein [Pseudomonas fragi]